MSRRTLLSWFSRPSRTPRSSARALVIQTSLRIWFQIWLGTRLGAMRLAKALSRPPLWVAGASLVTACATNPERLPELDRRFYYNLESKNDQQAFLELRDDERQAFLERNGLWQKWAALPESQRTTAAEGEIEIGFFEFAAFMAWGPPADTQTRDPDGRAVRQHTFIRCTSGPKAGRFVREVLECDGTSSEIVVTIRDGKVSEIAYPH